jgi:hypothetical protein
MPSQCNFFCLVSRLKYIFPNFSTKDDIDQPTLSRFLVHLVLKQIFSLKIAEGLDKGKCDELTHVFV